jgi:branched-chain amino acid transport system permease protein
MDASIALFLVQDGVVNGAIYALLALSLVLVFVVTRVIFIPQGEFVAFGALTYAALGAGMVPGSLWLLAGFGGAAFLAGLWHGRRMARARALAWLAAETLLLPALVIAATLLLAPRRPGVAVQALLALAIVTPMAPCLYRIAYQRLAGASILTLLIASIAEHQQAKAQQHQVLVFGPEGSRGAAFSDATLDVGVLTVPGQALWVLAATGALMAGLALFFAHTLHGKALRATAVNRLGARLVGIPAAQSGRIAFTLAGAIGALSGVLIVPLTTVYYDSGFLIGLKGFVAAIVGGLVSYPLAALAALLVGIVESFASFWASPFKEAIVFTLVIPVLLWRSLGHATTAEDEE